MSIGVRGTRWWSGPFAALVALVVMAVLGPVPTATALGYPTVGWPGAWTNPVAGGGSVLLTTKWGAFSLGCANADRSNDAGYYLDSDFLAHTGLDLNRGDGQEVYAIADGVVVENGQSWGSQWHNVVVIEHTTDSGEKFLAVYGHLYGDVVGKGAIARGARVGRVQRAGTGAHLHFGIRPGGWGGSTPRGSSDSGVDANRNCSFDPQGTVDPFSFLSARQPGSGTSWPPGERTYVTVRENGMVYRIAGGAPVYVGSWDRMGGPQPVREISQAQLDSLPVHPADGTFVRGVPSGRVFRIAGGAPLYVSSWDPFGGPQAATDVDDAAVDQAGGGMPWQHLRARPSDRFIVGASSGRVFRVVDDGHPYYIGSWDPFGGAQPTIAVDDWALDHCDHLDCNPFGNFEAATDSGGAVRLQGWAMDPNSGDPVDVGFFDDIRLAAVVGASEPRPDVDAVYHRGSRFGFDYRLPLTPGEHRICAAARNQRLGADHVIGCRSVTIQPPPRLVTAPELIGMARVSYTLQCSPGTWQDSTAVRISWWVNGRQVSTAPTYPVPESLVGQQVRCRATAVNPAGSTSADTAAMTIRVGPALRRVGAPVLSGTARVGSTLRTTTGNWAPAAMRYAYQWTRGGAAITGATASTYKLVAADRGKVVTCTVRASRTGWSTGTAAAPGLKVG